MLVTTLEESTHELGVQETHLVLHSTMSRRERRLLLGVLMKLSSAYKQNSCKAPRILVHPLTTDPLARLLQCARQHAFQQKLTRVLTH
jgi:hypothetical protein